MPDLRSQMIRIASGLPKGDPTRKEILAALLREGASEIDPEMLPPAQAKLVAWLGTRYGMRPRDAFDGIHGYVVGFKADANRARFDAAGLKKLLAFDVFRWVEPTTGGLSIGM